VSWISTELGKVHYPIDDVLSVFTGERGPSCVKCRVRWPCIEGLLIEQDRRRRLRRRRVA